MANPRARRSIAALGLVAAALIAALALAGGPPAVASTPGTTAVAPSSDPTVVDELPTTSTTSTTTAAPSTSPPAEPAPSSGGDDASRRPTQRATSEEQATGRVVISDGHVDIGPRFVDGAFTLQIRDDSGSADVWRSAADVVLWAVPESELAVPADPAYAFLGPAGGRSWLLPQTQVPGIVWPGWNTQAQSVKEQIPGAVDWRLHGVTGPGTFHLFLSGNFGQPDVIFDSTAPFPQSLAIPHNTHTHANWAFSEQGIYRLDVELSATTTAGLPVRDRRTIAVAVGDVDPHLAFLPGSDPVNPDTPGSSGATPGSGTTGADLAPGSGSSSSGSNASRGTGTTAGLGAAGDELPNAGAGSTIVLVLSGVACIAGGSYLVRGPGRRRARTRPWRGRTAGSMRFRRSARRIGDSFERVGGRDERMDEGRAGSARSVGGPARRRGRGARRGVARGPG